MLGCAVRQPLTDNRLNSNLWVCGKKPEHPEENTVNSNITTHAIIACPSV